MLFFILPVVTNRTPPYLLLIILVFLLQSGFAQSIIDPPYHINGSAYKENCHCYTLTQAENNQSGSVWNMNKIRLSSSFEFRFDVNLGCKDGDGADGIAFVLQPISTNVGTQGGGIGFEGVRPSVGIIIDTWQNNENNDPYYDHISININGDLTHNSSNNLAGPVQALNGSDNIEDCQWHSLTVRWDAITHELSAYVDNVLRVSATIDMVRDIFNNDPDVFWGFTSATGGSNNHQRFCTSLRAGFETVATTETCAPQEIQLMDISSSFGSIVEWHWDYGDGTTYNQPNPPPHYYPEPGNYTVSAAIKGNDGCWSDTFTQVITIGSIPEPDFLVPDTICGSTIIQPVDRSRVEYGTITEWNWSIGEQSHQGSAPPPVNHPNYEQVPVRLSVKTKEGCESGTVEKIVHLLPRPVISIAADKDIACVNEPILLEGISELPSNPVAEWKWSSLLGAEASANFAEVRSSMPGEFLVELSGKGENGCWSLPVEFSPRIFSTRAYAGRDTLVAIGQALQLQASGGEWYRWAPAGPLTDPYSDAPVAILDRPTTFVLTAGAEAGCETTDTIHVRVFRGPELYVPNAFTPNGDGKNDRFAFLAVGLKQVHYFRVYNRLGNLVYQGLDSAGWDGTLRGVDQPAGVYTWMISGEDYNGNAYVKKGTVLLIR